MENPEITLSEYWRIIRKRKMTIVFVFVSVMISTAIFTKLQTPVYQAALELKIEKQLPVIPTLTPQASLLRSGKTINLSTEMRLIKSLPVMRKVVERMEVLPADSESREKRIHALSLSYQNRVSVNQIGDTDIISISVTSSNPEKVALMTTAIADVYVVENTEGRKRQSKAVIEYINRQLASYQKQITIEEERLQKFKQNEKVFEVTEDVKAVLDRLTIEGSFEFESEMLQIENNLKALDAVFKDRRDEGGFSEILNSEALVENFIFTGLKRRLLELEFERFLLLIDYTEKHPDVIGQDQVINEVKNKIVEMLKGFSKDSISVDMEADLALIIKDLFLKNRKEVLFRIVNRFYGDSGSLSSDQLRYVSLKRNIERLLEAHDKLSKQREDALLSLAKVIDDVVTVVSPANVPSKPIKPNVMVNYVVSSAVGLLLGIIICFVKESIDSSVSTISDVEEELKLSILGVIPHMKKEEVLIGKEDDYDVKDKKLLYQKLRLVTVMDPKSWPAESLKMLRTNLVQLMKTKNLKTILFTSSDKQEGKSTIVTNMALAMAQLGKKTVLVGSNMRRPTSYKIFGLERDPGLSDILMGNVSWKEAINTSVDVLCGGLSIDHLLHIPGLDNLKVITCGQAVDNISELINSEAYDKLLKELKEYFDVVIVDCSPVMAVPDAITLCDKVDGVVLVYKVGHTAKDVLNRAKLNLLKANANLLGIVLNDIKTEAQVGYSAYYYRYYSETDEKNRKELKKKKWKRPLDFKSKV
ncbi:hypothetical protein MNBD_GAMMA03-2084 [hydrothermal vent metagenome]|uniref:non-specific protein-tyrosine kinase n=1 Tax=hydrothermal vent metagenome TaxID=652676 RepID=A0A3B0WC89_9ZZZZ